MSKYYELIQTHLGWLHNSNTSRGQFEDSKTILKLIDEIERLEQERNELQEEFLAEHQAAIDMWTQRDEAREKLVESREEVRRLRQEVEFLRQYGNKDCTAMADEALNSKDQPTT